MSLPTHYTRVVLHERPVADFTPTTFRSETLPFAALATQVSDDRLLVKIHWLSLDPAMRGYVRDAKSYLPPVKIGETMRGYALGSVVGAGEASAFRVGDVVRGAFGWTEYALVNVKDVEKVDVPPGASLLDFLGPLGTSGLTAYFGLIDVGQITQTPPKVLLCTGAAGSVGSLVCQLTRILSPRTKIVAVAGSPEKCAYLERELGVDFAVNYKERGWQKAVSQKVGGEWGAQGLDVVFDNVGGEILDWALGRMSVGGKVVLCGAISDYNATKPSGLKNYMSLISTRTKIEGFIVLDYLPRWPQALRELASFVQQGKLKTQYHVVEGLGNAAGALGLLFSGGNEGKLVVKVSDAPREGKGREAKL